MPHWMFDPQHGGGSSSGFPATVVITSSGWPFPALKCEEVFSQALRDAVKRSGKSYSVRDYYPLRRGFDIRQFIKDEDPLFSDWPVDRPIPYGLIRPGFAIDSLFYAAIWFVFIFTVGRMKCWNRQRRGLCPMCKYDLRGNPNGHSGGGCPECGWGRET